MARQVLAGASPSRAVWASARIRSTPPRHSRARASATQLSTVLPSGSFPSARARSAAAAHRSAARPSTLAELADRYGIPLPSMTGYGSFAVFIGTYTAACQVLRSEDDLRRLVREVVEDAVLAGAMWVEPSLGPANHRDRLGADHDVVALVLEEGHRAAQQLDVGLGLMIAAARDGGWPRPSRPRGLPPTSPTPGWCRSGWTLMRPRSRPSRSSRRSTLPPRPG